MLESAQVSFESEEKQKNEALKQKKKLEVTISELELELDQSQRLNTDLKSCVKKLQASVAELEGQVDKDLAKITELNGEIAAGDLRANAALVELRDTRRLLEAADRAKVSVENDLHEASVHINEMTVSLASLTVANKNLEATRMTLQGELDDVSSEAKNSEEKARRACDDAARIAEELRQEQDHSAYEEHNGRSLEALVVDLQNKVSAYEAGGQREEKRQIHILEAKVSIRLLLLPLLPQGQSFRTLSQRATSLRIKGH